MHSKVVLGGFVAATMAATAAVTWTIAASVLVPKREPITRADVEAMVRDGIARNADEVRRIVKETMSNPDIMQTALADMIKKRVGSATSNAPARPAAPDYSTAIKENEEAIFRSSHQVTLGNKSGDVTLVEFFDYNCGYCKRALSDKLTLLESDPRLRIVLKEFPVLGPGSLEAARVAVAVRMQDASGKKYLAFHQKLMAEREANNSNALAAARDAGVDMDRLQQDMTSAEAAETLTENRRLAGLLGINGTPSYVVGRSVVVGAVGLAELNQKIAAARKQ